MIFLMADPKPKPPSAADLNVQIGEIIDRALGARGVGDKTGFLGLPSGSTANETGAYMDVPTPAAPGQKAPPIYRDGAQNMPLLSGWDPLKIGALQTQLVQAGVLDDDYLDGWWDPVSAKAFETILAEANDVGTPDYNVIINARINSQPMEIDPKTGIARRRTGTGTKNSQRAPLSLTLSNKDDLTATAQEVAQKRIGRTFTPDEINRFVSSYHAAEGANQRSQYGDQTPGGAGGATMVNASAETAANTFAEQVDPVASQARNMLPMVKSISDLLNGSEDVNTVQPLQGGFSNG
jgi:hypothetical protein